MKFEFIESPAFTAYLPDYLADEEYTALQEYLCEHPDARRYSQGLRWSSEAAMGSAWNR